MKKQTLETILYFMYKHKIKLFRNYFNRKLDILNDNLISNREEIQIYGTYKRNNR